MLKYFTKFFASDEQVEEDLSLFGRYTDGYKSAHHYDVWDASLANFKAGKILTSIENVLDFLHDPTQQNSSYFKKDGVIEFKIYQGSSCIFGDVDKHGIRAYAKVAGLGKQQDRVAVLRRLLDQNYALRYCKYALHNDCIELRFHSQAVDASPYKIYYGLKELALLADQQDDLLKDHYKSVVITDKSHVKNKSLEEQQQEYTFIKITGKAVLEQVAMSKVDASVYPMTISYPLLAWLYMLDYLIVPQGWLLEQIERSHQEFYADALPITIRNIALMNTVRNISTADFNRLQPELYRTKHTFGLTSPCNHQQVCALLQGELTKIDWYQRNQYMVEAQSIMDYIVGFLLYSYAVPPPDKALLHLYIQVRYPLFFEIKGFESYVKPDGSLMKKDIQLAIIRATARYKTSYPTFDPDLKMLEYHNVVSFSESFLHMMIATDCDNDN